MVEEVHTFKEAYDILKEAADAIRPFRLIIAGTRTFSDYERLKAECDKALSARLPNVVVISGGNRRYDKEGRALPTADTMGERYAIERELECRIIPAKWEAHSKSAGPRRNKVMAGMADAAIVFTSGSPGSASMISEAKKAGIPVRIIRY